MTNDQFRVLLSRYFHSASFSRADKLLSFFFHSVLLSKNAAKVSAAFKEIENSSKNFDVIHFEIENYSGKNIYASKISEFLKTRISGELTGSYVHGSIATSEEIFYSDFDGLVILKNDVLDDVDTLKKVANVLKQSEKIMYEMDPLQHHGWFIITEADLKNYPEYYFPSELLNYSKCLFGENKLTLQIRKSGFEKQYAESFNKMANGILNKLDSKSFLKNYYSFKNLLSEFMLLPSFYLQVKTGKGIFKKFSFEKVKNELGEKYSVMDEISSIRKDWNYQPPAFYSALKNNTGLFSRLLQAKYFSGNLPLSIKNKFDNTFIQRMKSFVTDLKSNLAK